jgi:hypothetical protein
MRPGPSLGLSGQTPVSEQLLDRRATQAFAEAMPHVYIPNSVGSSLELRNLGAVAGGHSWISALR